jgi:hypothetical protein
VASRARAPPFVAAARPRRSRASRVSPRAAPTPSPRSATATATAARASSSRTSRRQPRRRTPRSTCLTPSSTSWWSCATGCRCGWRRRRVRMSPQSWLSARSATWGCGAGGACSATPSPRALNPQHHAPPPAPPSFPTPQDKCEPPIYVSDRRFMKSVQLLQVVAHADGRAEANEYDTLLLEHVFGNRPDDAAKARGRRMAGGGVHAHAWRGACARAGLPGALAPLPPTHYLSMPSPPRCAPRCSTSSPATPACSRRSSCSSASSAGAWGGRGAAAWAPWHLHASAPSAPPHAARPQA